MVIDCDVHQGNGTAFIFRKKDYIFTFSIHQMDIYPAEKPASSLDVGLWSGDGDKEYFPGQGLTEHEEIGKLLYPHQVGIVQKCVFCKERIDDGLEKGLTPGVDRDASPACMIACPTKAIEFGDLDDPYSGINRLIKERKGDSFHREFGTEPSIYYID